MHVGMNIEWQEPRSPGETVFAGRLRKNFRHLLPHSGLSRREREVKESGHPFGSAQDELLRKVRNTNISIDRGMVFFPHSASASAAPVRLPERPAPVQSRMRVAVVAGADCDR